MKAWTQEDFDALSSDPERLEEEAWVGSENESVEEFVREFAEYYYDESERFSPKEWPLKVVVSRRRHFLHCEVAIEFNPSFYVSRVSRRDEIRQP